MYLYLWESEFQSTVYRNQPPFKLEDQKRRVLYLSSFLFGSEKWRVLNLALEAYQNYLNRN
jgi:hypothetical protein